MNGRHAIKAYVYAILFCAVLSTPAAAQTDAIDLATAVVANSPPDIASWPVTATISHLDMSTPAGLSFTFSAQNTWPNYTPPTWTGALQYTVWPVVFIDGRWRTAGIIQMWQGRPSTGAPILSDFAKNWTYDTRWGALAGYQPHQGELFGFFLSAGNARGETGVTSVRARTNVVTVELPVNDTGSFDFPIGNSGLPMPPPVTSPTPTPTTTSDLQPLLDQIAALKSEVDALNQTTVALAQLLRDADDRRLAAEVEMNRRLDKIPTGCVVQFFRCRLAP